VAFKITVLILIAIFSLRQGKHTICFIGKTHTKNIFMSVFVKKYISLNNRKVLFYDSNVLKRNVPYWALPVGLNESRARMFIMQTSLSFLSHQIQA